MTWGMIFYEAVIFVFIYNDQEILVMISDETQKSPFFNLRREGVVCLFLVIITLAVYWQVGNHEFVNYDDNDYITENQHVQAGLTLKSIAWAFTSTHASNWHPLTWLSHMLDCQIYGLNPSGHHFTSVLFHILNSILLFLIFKRMTRAFWKSAFVAALFAIHPLHVESVAWVAERKDVLSTFFWMLTMGAYILYVQNPGIKKYLLTVLLFALGLMAKPMLITLPFVLLLLDYWPLGRFNKRSLALKLIQEKIPFFVLAAASSIATLFAQQSGGAVESLDAIPLFVRISNAIVSYLSYIGKMILPHNLAVLYPHPGMPPVWQIAGGCLLLVFISFIAVKTLKWHPYFAVGWLWYLGTLVPVIGLVQVGLQSMADRYTYIPLTGIFIIIAWGVSDLAAGWRYKKEGLAAASAILLLILIVATWFQVGHWTNSITLFKHAINVTENNSVANNNLGTAFSGQGKVFEAIKHYTEALRIDPMYADAHYNLGNAFVRQGRISEAISHYTEALRIKPNDAEVRSNLGSVLFKQGRVDEAIGHYTEALRINPVCAEAHNNLGNVLADQGRISEAISHYTEALRINPDFAEAGVNLKKVSAFLNEIDEAVKRLQELLEVNPEDPRLHYDLGTLYYKKGEFDKAIFQYQKSLSIQPDNPSTYYNIACMYSIQNRVEKSIDFLKSAIEKGYDNWDHIRNDRDLENVRSSPYYKELVGSY
jgi:tetratricopeptide (TPR) repeat protein